jgi:phospholipid transport system substrate-binding protein
MRGRVVRSLVVVAFSLLSLPALAADAGQVVIDLGNKTLDILNQKQMAEGEREQRFRALWHEGFDVPSISRNVLGRYWREASEQQHQDFTKALEDYVVRIYSQRFNEYSGETFKVLRSRGEGEEAYVNTQIVRPNGAPPVKVDWRLRKAGDTYKIVDVIVEGISMVQTQRDEFSAVIQRNGGQVDALIQMLREKAKA